jgi:hypothetical protein
MVETIQKTPGENWLTGFAVSDKFQPELAADSRGSALKSVQCNARIGGIEQAVECSAAGLHADGHGRLGEAILVLCCSRAWSSALADLPDVRRWFRT